MRSRRNNLIIEELAGEAGDGDPAAIIRTFLADNLDIFGVCIQCDILGDDKHHMNHDNRMLGP